MVKVRKAAEYILGIDKFLKVTLCCGRIEMLEVVI